VTADGLTVDTADQVFINHSGDGGGIRIDSTNATNTSSLKFGDVADNYIGALEYNHSNDSMTMYVNNAERMRIDSSGRVGIGMTPSADVSITNVAAGLIQIDGNIDIRYSGSNTDPNGARYLSFINTDTTLVSGQPMGGMHWVGLDSSNPNSRLASITSYCAGNAGTTGDLRFGIGATEAMRIDSSSNVGIGVSGPAAKVDIRPANEATNTFRIYRGISGGYELDYLNISQYAGDSVFNSYSNNAANSEFIFQQNGTERMRVTTDNLLLSQTAPSQDFGDGRVFISMKGRESADYSGVQMANYGTTGNDQNLGILAFWDGTTSENARIAAIRESATTDAGLRFYTRPTGGSLTERLRINHDGNLLFGDNLNTSAATNDVAGVTVGKVGNIQASVDENPCLFVNRKGGDGTIVSIRQAGGEEGTISVSGSTVSYNAFSGSHWSRLTDNSQPTILKGTLIETIDEMCDWYQAQFTIPATTKVNEDGTVEDVAAYTVKEPIALPNEASVGDTISHISNDVTYSATIVKENDNKHTKCKISDTADSLRVYGVFAAWDGDDDTVNDMYVTAVGTHVVRIHGGQTVSAGDLLVSNGDGTAKVQEDDIIRSKTLGKVLTNIKQETYADNSYTVPCALYCG
jgi:hypothetical protein